MNSPSESRKRPPWEIIPTTKDLPKNPTTISPSESHKRHTLGIIRIKKDFYENLTEISRSEPHKRHTWDNIRTIKVSLKNSHKISQTVSSCGTYVSFWKGHASHTRRVTFSEVTAIWWWSLQGESHPVRKSVSLTGTHRNSCEIHCWLGRYYGTTKKIQ